MLRTFVILFVFFLLAPKSKIKALNHVFTIVLTDGKVLFDKDDGKPKIKLKIGDSIGYGTIIIVDKQVLSLIYKNGNIIELTKPGFYNCKTLESNLLTKAPAPVCNDLIHLFLEIYCKEIKSHYYRRRLLIARNEPSFNFNFINTGHGIAIFNDSTTKISWSSLNKPKNSLKFTLLLRNLFGDSITIIDTKDTLLEINPAFITKYLKDDKLFLLQITNSTDYTNDFNNREIALYDKRDIILFIYVKKDYLKYLTLNKKLLKEFNCKNSLTGDLLQALINEKYHLPYLAEKYYKTFIQKIHQENSNNYNLENEYENLYLALKRIHTRY